MNKLVVMLSLAVAAVFPAWAKSPDEIAKFQVRALVELRDGSRLVGKLLEKELPVTLDFAQASIPINQIRVCEMRSKDERVVLNLQNGDKLTGVLELEAFKLNSGFGNISLEPGQINRITFSTWREGNMPAGEGSLFFGGVNWDAWRTAFEIQGDKLMSRPKARPGFNYGHNGNGRGPTLMSNIGNSDWRDYGVEFDYCLRGVDPAFNPYGLGLDFHAGAIMFHVVDAKESWNECGSSGYTFAINGDGTWTLYAAYNAYCPTPVGFSNMRNDAQRTLTSGSGLQLDFQSGNKYRIEVRGSRIQIWTDGKPVLDVTDEKMGETIGGKTLDHGGVGFGWNHDTMGWIRNFSATQL